MPNLHIRDLDQLTYDELKAAAVRSGRDLNKEVIHRLRTNSGIPLRQDPRALFPEIPIATPEDVAVAKREGRLE